MSRSPIMNALRGLARDHAEAWRRGVDVRKLREAPPADGLGRRRFLQGAGLAIGAATLPRVPLARGTKGPRIAIVGGGVAGLGCALALQDRGVPSTIYEAAAQVGGRMHSNTTDWLNGQKSEWCAEFIDTGQAAILGLAKRFGLAVIDEVAAQPAGSDDTLFFRGKYYAREQADRDFAPVNATLQIQLKAAPSTLYNSHTRTGRFLDSISVYDWIDKYVPGGHDSDLGRFLDSAYTEEFGLDTRLQSSLNLVSVLGAQPSSGPWQIFGASDQRFSIDGGNQRLPEAIAAALPKESILAEHALTKIARHGSGHSLVFRTSAGTKAVTADKVVLTLPFSVLRTIDYASAGFNSLKHAAIQELGYGTNSKLSLQFDERPWSASGPWGRGNGTINTDLFFQNTWDSSRGIGAPGSASGVLTAYMGGSNGASFTATNSPYASAATDPAVKDYARAFLLQLEAVWPGASKFWNGRATLSTSWRDPNLLGSYACWKVGQYVKFAGYEGVRQGNCHFAGEHCSTGSQGFMEGAAAEGIRAAAEILGGR